MAKASGFAGLVMVLLLAAVPAAAAATHWTKNNAASPAKGKALAMSATAGTTPSTSASGPDVTVTWAQNSFQSSTTAVPTSKILRYRSPAGGTGLAVAAGCDGNAASGCVEKTVPLGDWYYTEQPSVGGWTGTESARSTVRSIGSLAISKADRQPNKNDTITITFPARLQASTVCSAWTDNAATQTLTSNGNGGPLTVTFTKGTGGANDSVSFSSSSCTGGLNLGTIDLGTTGYVGNGGTATFNDAPATSKTATTLVYTPGSTVTSASTVVVTLGTGNGTSAASASATQPAVYSPASGIKYASTGTPAVSGSLTSGAGPLF
jgi:hypothetical protein